MIPLLKLSDGFSLNIFDFLIAFLGSAIALPLGGESHKPPTTQPLGIYNIEVLPLVQCFVEILKKPLFLGVLACIVSTLVFGGLLSLAVNLSLEQLQQQEEIFVPGAPDSSQPL